MAILEVSDLVFPAFNKAAMEKLPEEYGIEIFYEFGSNSYWNAVLRRMGASKRPLSLHGPCVTVNLAEMKDTAYLKRYKKTFAYAKKAGASHVVVHTNEGWHGDAAVCRQLVIRRLHKIERLAEDIDGAQMVIENVGLKQNNLFDEEAYIALFNEFQTVGAIIDVGHAHVNGWNICRVIEALNGRIKAFHLQDNGGEADEHLPLFAGTVDWPAIIAAVKQYAPQATLVFEYANGNYEKADDLVRDLDIVRERLGI